MGALGSIGWKVIDRVHVFGHYFVSPQNLLLSAGLITGAAVFLFVGKARGFERRHLGMALLAATAGGLIGARIGFLITYPSSAAPSVLSGMSLAGGIVGGALVARLLAGLLRLSFLRLADAASPGVALGMAVGRAGQLISGSGFGKPSSGALAFVYQGGRLPGFTCFIGQCSALLVGDRQMFLSRRTALLLGPTGARIASGTGVEPVPLFAMLSALALLLVLGALAASRALRRDGVAFTVFLTWICASGLSLGSMTLDRTWFGLTGTQWTAIAGLAAAVATAAWVVAHPGEAPAEEPPADGTTTEEPTTRFEPPQPPGSV